MNFQHFYITVRSPPLIVQKSIATRIFASAHGYTAKHLHR
ncbi:Uncharacterised protein [Serratia marcescens]|nr:hypothetical protein DP21_3815 [Serratia marcescens]CAI0917925.1 Uncharacterised protein [Serratia marcescens]CAI1749144.1 Uncharacterised protein [Serratia marcescens]SUI38629.1 Uncharacterised protein [Serratia marcescens]